MHEPNPDRGENTALTTVHVRRATEGDTRSLGLVVSRLAPLLVAHARYRIGAALRNLVEPEELVHEAWLAALPKLSGLRERDGRITPVLLRFLTTTINYRVNDRLRRLVRDGTPPDTERGATRDRLSEASGVITRAVRHERIDRVRECIDGLAERDREILVLRGIEQNSAKTVGILLDLAPAAVDQRYSRALKRLRAALPDSVFAELDGE